MMCNPLSAAILSAELRSTLAIALHRRLQVGRGCSGVSLFNHASIISDIHPVTSLLLFLAIILMVYLVIPRIDPISSQLALNCLLVWNTSLKSGWMSVIMIYYIIYVQIHRSILTKNTIFRWHSFSVQKKRNEPHP